MRHVLTALLVVFFLASCAGEYSQNHIWNKGTIERGGNMEISSPDFEDNGEIPKEFTCDGEDRSPELHINGVPEGTKALALVMDDPDAPTGTFTHWAVWNMPSGTSKIGMGEEPEGVQGTNSFGNRGYGGPCPPSGTHRYYFRLYALDTELELEEGSSKEDLEDAMRGHVAGMRMYLLAYQ